MGRGATWGDLETGHLAKAWTIVSQDPIFGIEQTSMTFYGKIYEIFISFKPPRACNKSYDAQGCKAARCKLENMFAGIQKFKISKREVRVFNPTGTTEEENLSMEIGRHIRKYSTITYEAKDTPHESWPHHLAYRELRLLPNFSDEMEEGTKKKK